MKIVSLIAENVKKLRAVEIRPDGNMVVIAGKNRAGKSSVLDSIWWALDGAKHIQSAPIRKGANEARIKLDLGELLVTRTFRQRDGEEIATSIVVESADGSRFSSPQRVIDALLGELTFDPLAFARMDPKQQLDALRQFVPGIDFAAISRADLGDRERRRDLGRLAEQERGAAQAITTPANTPDQPVDVDALVGDLERAGERNTQIADERARRHGLQERAHQIADQLEALKRRSTEMRERYERELRELEQEVDKLGSENEGLGGQLRSLPEMEQAIDTTEIRGRIEAARKVNENVQRLSERMKHHARALQLQGEVETLSAKIDKRQADKAAAIAQAKMPIPGIGFGSDHITFNGIPFDQASDAEQLQVSVSIAMAMNPKLRVIRVRDGSLLDEDAMKILSAMCDEHDFQCWVERVDTSGKVGFVLEDGHLKEGAR